MTVRKRRESRRVLFNVLIFLGVWWGLWKTWTCRVWCWMKCCLPWVRASNRQAIQFLSINITYLLIFCYSYKAGVFGQKKHVRTDQKKLKTKWSHSMTCQSTWLGLIDLPLLRRGSLFNKIDWWNESSTHERPPGVQVAPNITDLYVDSGTCV